MVDGGVAIKDGPVDVEEDIFFYFGLAWGCRMYVHNIVIQLLVAETRKISMGSNTNIVILTSTIDVVYWFLSNKTGVIESAINTVYGKPINFLGANDDE